MKSYWNLIRLTSLICMGAVSSFAQTKPVPTSALNALQLYCDKNFIGETSYARYDYAKPRPNEGGSWDIDSDPMVIVSTYHVVGAQVNGDSAIGKVIFEQLAYTRGDGNAVNYNPNPREIIPEYKEGEAVEYQLKNIGGRWYIYNPPAMRVSLAAVNKDYFFNATSFLPKDFWIDPEFSNEQRRNIAKKFSDIKMVMQISADYLDRLRERYKEAGGPEYPDSERQKRVQISYTGKWNLEVVPEKK